MTVISTLVAASPAATVAGPDPRDNGRATPADTRTASTAIQPLCEPWTPFRVIPEPDAHVLNTPKIVRPTPAKVVHMIR